MAKRRSRKPAGAQNEVLARTLASQSKSQIAREMGIDRQTVTRIQECHNLPQLLEDSRAHVVEKVVPDAVQSMHAQILDRSAPGDGNLAVRVLEGVGVLGKDAHPQTVVYDERIEVACATLLPPPRAEWLREHPEYVQEREAALAAGALAQPRQVPAQESAPTPALGDSGSVPASGEVSNCAGDAAQAHSQPAQAELMPEPAQPGHTQNCDCTGCNAARTIARAIAKASAQAEGDASAQEARGGGEWW